MRTSRAVLIATVVTLVTSLSFARNNGPNGAKTTLIARLSYSSTWDVSPGQKKSPRICLAVFQDGHYRMLRTTPDGEAQRLQGTIEPEELRQVELLLETPTFRALAGQHGGMIRSGSESFVAEVPREEGMQHVLLMNPDREQPFPEPAADVINWLQGFEPKHAEALVDTEFPDICPQFGPPVRPIFADNLRPPGPMAFCTKDVAGTPGTERR